MTSESLAIGELMPGPKWLGYYLALTDCGQAEIEDPCWHLQMLLQIFMRNLLIFKY